jgi:hypothetical protein
MIRQGGSLFFENIMLKSGDEIGLKNAEMRPCSDFETWIARRTALNVSYNENAARGGSLLAEAIQPHDFGALAGFCRLLGAHGRSGQG